MDDIEALESISLHPIFGVIEFYNSIEIAGQWYTHDRVNDQLVRSTKPALQQELFNGEE